MIGSKYWATGIVVRYSHPGRWGAHVDFLDDGFASDSVDKGRISTEGALRTRYYVDDGTSVDALTAAIDVVKADAERLGIVWRPVLDGPLLFIHDEDEYGLPAGWRGLLNEQAKRLGWSVPFTTPQET